MFLNSLMFSLCPKKYNIIFRQTESNRFTLPVLLHTLERSKLDQQFKIQICSSQHDLRQAVSFTTPKIILYSFMTPHIRDVWQELMDIKPKSRKTLWIAGGPHATGDPDSILKMGFDIAAIGEGEILLPRICTDFLESGLIIQNSLYKSTDIFPLDESFPISDLDSFVPPLEITRGCFYRCRFCQTGSIAPRHRSMDSILDFFTRMKNAEFLTRTGFICPSGFEYGADKPGRMQLEKVEKILRMAKEIGFQHVEYGLFPTEVRPETVTPEGLALIKKYCSNKKITIGGQTGSPGLLRKIRRGHTLGQMEQAAAYIREAGLTPQIDIILGLPDETFDDRLQTLTWIKKLHRKFHIRIQVHYFLPLAGTSYADAVPKSLGRKIESLLHDYYRAGVCTNWWIEGKKMSRTIITTKEKLKNQSE